MDSNQHQQEAAFDDLFGEVNASAVRSEERRNLP